MKVGIDIGHIAYWNFYRYIIDDLEKQGHKVYIIVRLRGKLLDVIKKEYSKHENIHVLGKYRKSILGKIIFHTLRIIPLFFFLRKHKIDVTTCDTYYIGFASIMAGIPSIMHSDDYEYTLSFKTAFIFSKKIIVPDVFPVHGKKVLKYHGCKECAYLSSDYFSPDLSTLDQFHVKEDDYVFIRLISHTSFNYIGGESAATKVNELIDFLTNNNLKVLLSSEEEIEITNPNVTLLAGPIKSYHSILKYAKFIITEGDTMAREASILGTPTIYIGGRKMLVNSYFSDAGILIENNEMEDIKATAQQLIDRKDYQKKSYESFGFDDINQIIVRELINN
jgi:predicted glycosyltransferase